MSALDSVLFILRIKIDWLLLRPGKKYLTSPINVHTVANS